MSSKHIHEAVLELLDSIDPRLPPLEQIKEESAVHELAEELDDPATLRLVTGALVERAKSRHPSFRGHAHQSEAQERRNNEPKGFIEVSAEQLPVLGERLLKGRNAAMIIRAGQYGDVGNDIIEPLRALGGFSYVGKERFPRKGDNSGHTDVHLDYFDDPGSPFRYSLSASRTEKGQVLFVAGLASSRVYGWSESQYQQARTSLSTTNRILGLRQRATDPTSPRGEGYCEWREQQKGLEGTMAAMTLNEGDIAIWPQGGRHTGSPAWHGFFQIGHPKHPKFEARQSVSYHFV